MYYCSIDPVTIQFLIDGSYSKHLALVYLSEYQLGNELFIISHHNFQGHMPIFYMVLDPSEVQTKSIIKSWWSCHYVLLYDPKI